MMNLTRTPTIALKSRRTQKKSKSSSFKIKLKMKSQADKENPKKNPRTNGSKTKCYKQSTLNQGG